MGVRRTYEPKLHVTRIDTIKIYITNMTFRSKNAFSSRAAWSPIFGTLENSNFKASKNKNKLPGCS
jgi:hypothetical protein